VSAQQTQFSKVVLVDRRAVKDLSVQNNQGEELLTVYSKTHAALPWLIHPFEIRTLIFITPVGSTDAL
jgi:hypothetical protein